MNFNDQIAGFFYPTLIAIVGFFLLQFYFLVRKMNESITEIKIKLATGDFQFDSLEKRLEWCESEIEKIKEFINKK